MGTANNNKRLAVVDVARGFAVAMMIAFHFCYDLNYFGWIRINMLVDSPWLEWRTGIVTSFLAVVGVSLVLRESFKPSAKDFRKRWGEIALAAAIVTVSTIIMFPRTYVYFGVLHFVAAALIIGRLLMPLGVWNIAVGVASFAAWFAIKLPFFDPKYLNWIGLISQKPYTEDFVPIFPWIGVVLISMGLTKIWQRRNYAMIAPVAWLNENPPRLLKFLGSWPLLIYLLHQPIMMGILGAIKTLTE